MAVSYIYCLFSFPNLSILPPLFYGVHSFLHILDYWPYLFENVLLIILISILCYFCSQCSWFVQRIYNFYLGAYLQRNCFFRKFQILMVVEIPYGAVSVFLPLSFTSFCIDFSIQFSHTGWLGMTFYSSTHCLVPCHMVSLFPVTYCSKCLMVLQT